MRMNNPAFTRRKALKTMLASGAGLAASRWWNIPSLALESVGESGATNAPAQSSLAPEDDALLEEVEKASFLFFWEQTNPETGLVKDRCNIRTSDNTLAASIA